MLLTSTVVLGVEAFPIFWGIICFGILMSISSLGFIDLVRIYLVPENLVQGIFSIIRRSGRNNFGLRQSEKSISGDYIYASDMTALRKSRSTRVSTLDTFRRISISHTLRTPWKSPAHPTSQLPIPFAIIQSFERNS